MPTGPGHDQFRTGLQGPQQLPNRNVEAERGLLQHDVASIQRVGVLHPQQAVDHAGVLVHHPFGQAGRARGVDDVRQVLRGEPRHLRVAGRQFKAQRRVQIDHDAMLRHLPGRRVHQYRYRRAVGEHVADTFCRVVRIDRHISAACLQDPEQAHHHRQAAFDTDRHAIVGFHTQRDQVVSQAVGLGVELLEGQLALLGTDGDSLRGALYLILDQSMQRVIEPVGLFGSVKTY